MSFVCNSIHTGLLPHALENSISMYSCNFFMLDIVTLFNVTTCCNIKERCNISRCVLLCTAQFVQQTAVVYLNGINR